MAILLQCIKAQGASIKDVYVLYNLAGNSSNSYVAMTRHIKEVKLCYSIEVTRNIASLISQLSKIDSRLSSINFKTLEELVAIQDQENTSPNIINKVGHWFKGVIEDIQDRLHLRVKLEPVEIIKSEPPATVAAIVRNTSVNPATRQEKVMTKNKIDYHAINKQETVELKQRLSFKAAEIGINLLGSPNKHLSNSQLLRWDKDGKIAMKINGNKAGIWHDF